MKKRILILVFLLLISVFLVRSDILTNDLYFIDTDTTYSHLSNFSDDLAHVEDDSSWNKTYADSLYAILGYGDDWNKSYADTLYAILSHTIVSHDTDTTGAELTSLADNSMVDTLHRHSELSASDGTPDRALVVDAAGKVSLSNDLTVDTDLLFVDIAPGRVGIGTAPATDFHVVGESYFDGNVGIGTTTPSVPLDVVGNALFTSRYVDITGGYTDLRIIATTDNAGITINSPSDEYNSLVYSHGASTLWNIGTIANDVRLAFRQAGATEVMTLEEYGDVGIGTSSPVSKLEINDATFTGTYGSYADERASLLVSGTNPYHSIQLSSTYNNADYPNYGLVLVNGPSTSDFDVWGIMHDGPANADGGLQFAYLHGTGSAANIHVATPVVTFQKSGNVGIGTATPAAKLAINGGLHVGGDSDPGDNNLLVDGTISQGGSTLDSQYTNLVYQYSSGFGEPTTTYGLKITIPAGSLGAHTHFGTYLISLQGRNVEELWVFSAEKLYNNNFRYNLERLSGKQYVTSAILVNNPTSTGNFQIELQQSASDDDWHYITVHQIGTPHSNTVTFVHIASTSFGSGTDVTKRGWFNSGSTYDDLFYNDGNVGIGTAAPDTKLEIAGAHVSNIGMLHLDSSDSAYLSLDSVSSASDSGIYFSENNVPQMIFGWDAPNNRMRFYDMIGPGTRMVIEQGGNVGIGDATPSYELDVAGDIRATGKLYGWNVPTDATRTTATHNGAFGGPQAMNTWIQTNGCAGYHVCNILEAIAWNMDGNNMPGPAWIITGSGGFSSIYQLDTYNDCGNFHYGSTTSFGLGYYSSTGQTSRYSCDTLNYVLCCI